MEERRRGHFFIIAVPTFLSTAIVLGTAFQITYDVKSSVYASAGLIGGFVIMLSGFILKDQRGGRWYSSEILPLLAGYAPVCLLSVLLLLLDWRRGADPGG